MENMETPPQTPDNTAAAYRFEFRGNAGEYFKIWLANVLLTILTLGIYSAWAKVRTKRYFYANTFLDGANFEYHAKPLSILISRMLVLAIIGGGGYWASNQGVEIDATYTFLVLIFLPWALVRGLSFNARNSSHRNIRFYFQRSYGFPYLFNVAIFTGVGMIFMPWLMRGYQKYKSERHQWGKLRFVFRRPSAVPYAAVADRSSHRDKFNKPPIWPYIAIFWLAPVAFGAIASVIFIIATAGVVVDAKILEAKDLFSDEVKQSAEYIFAAVFAVIVLAAVFIFKAQAHLFQLFWNSIRTENGAVFYCDFSVREFAYEILLVNFFAVWLSFGLLHPWAKVRKTRFLTERMKILSPPGAMENILARRGEDESAFGEEFESAEGFDFDVGLI
ncbi:MAG: DUF898 domain-containing protein [Betaproteobacteria bacterium]|nr:DUF898 domain-containing protein [Betaproteobacteria bacterium]